MQLSIKQRKYTAGSYEDSNQLISRAVMRAQDTECTCGGSTALLTRWIQGNNCSVFGDDQNSVGMEPVEVDMISEHRLLRRHV